MANVYKPYLRRVVIETDSNESGTVDLEGMAFVGIVVLSDFEGSSLTIKNSVDGSTDRMFFVTDSDGTEFTVDAASNRHILINPTASVGLKHIQLVSDVTQTADCELFVVCRWLS